MVRINLLPYKRESIRKINYLLVYCIVWLILFFLSIGCTIYLEKQKKDLRKDIGILKEQIQHEMNIISQLDKLKRQEKIIDQKIRVIIKMKQYNSTIVRLVDATITNFPNKKMFLTRYVVDLNQVQIEGLALNLSIVAQYMKQLETTKYFVTVSLKEIKRQRFRNYDLVSFLLILVPKT